MKRGLHGIPVALVSGLLLGAAPAEPRPAPTRTVEEKGYRVRLDLKPQVLAIAIPEDRAFGEGGAAAAPIAPTLGVEVGGLVSGSMLAQKAKQFDDGLYAAVELAAQQGAGTFAGKAAMLAAVAGRLDGKADGPASGNPAVILLTACRLGGVPARVPAGLDGPIADAERSFLLRSKPLGFYTWSAPLSAIYRQDRMLQSELTGADRIGRLARALSADPGARRTYDAYLTLTDRLTNPGGSLADLRGALRAIEAGRPQGIPRNGVAIVPASRSHEGDLVMKLYGDRPIPEGFSLVDEMIRRIRSGQIDLKPTDRSGWYDYQTWALEPLVIPERMPEAARLRMDDGYRKQLLDLFRGVLALTRETHVKQLEIPAPGEAPGGGGVPPVTIYIAPELSAEPLVSYYRRRAASYEFIRTGLIATFGPAGLRAIHRQTAAGPVATDLAAELEAMRALFAGAAATTARQLGMPADAKADADAAAFRSWAGAANQDPDVGRDARMMVPIFYDGGRRKTKVWAFLGWSRRPAIISFATPPAFEVTRDGRKLAPPAAPRVEFSSAFRDLSYPVTAEVYVEELLDRAQFRKLCDTYRTRAAILEHLK